MSSLAIALGLAFTLAGTTPNGNTYPPLEQIYPRCIVNQGNTARIEHVFAKADKGEPIVIGVIGGSITEGASATKHDYKWGTQVYNWWKKNFPKANVTLKNAGIGATGSDFAIHRMEKHLMNLNPDFVAVEFSVNDADRHQQHYEGVLRQILYRPGTRAAITVHMMNEHGYNREKVHLPLAKYYDLPAISYRAALWPEIAAKKLVWKDISPDTIHPNNMGHTYTAGLVCNFLQKTLDNYRAKNNVPAQIKPLPEKPMFTANYDRGEMLDLSKVKIIENNGFTLKNDKGYAKYGPYWVAEKPGSKLVVEVEGPYINVLYYRMKKPLGHTAVRVDGKQVAVLEGYHDGWWTYTPVQEILKNSPGTHKIEFELLNKKHKNSQGYGFELRGIMRSGY